MKKLIYRYLTLLVITTSFMLPKAQPSRVKAWLQLDQLRQALATQINDNNKLISQIKNNANLILQDNITKADELTQSDPVAAYALYHEMKKFKDIAIKNSIDIDAINQKFQDLCCYIDQQVKELKEIRRKHMQFPN